VERRQKEGKFMKGGKVWVEEMGRVKILKFNGHFYENGPMGRIL